MYYYSTRDKNRNNKLKASDAILKGLAEDGGLFVPDHLPSLPSSLSVDMPYGRFAAMVMKPFFEGDELSEEARSQIDAPPVEKAFRFNCA